MESILNIYYLRGFTEEKKPFHAQICFHFQQAAEKYLKAYIIHNNLEFWKTHDLPLLLKQCVSIDSAFKNYAEDCEYLIIIIFSALLHFSSL